MEDDNTGYNYTGYESAFVPTPAGEAVPTDSGDAKTTTINGKVTVSKTSPNVRRWNPLGEFSSYTYQISLYMITPDAYDLFIASGRQQLNVLNNINASCSGGGAYLVAQSGGINDTNSTRADGFNFDYYIDNLRMRPRKEVLRLLDIWIKREIDGDWQKNKVKAMKAVVSVLLLKGYVKKFVSQFAWELKPKLQDSVLDEADKWYCANWSNYNFGGVDVLERISMWRK